MQTCPGRRDGKGCPLPRLAARQGCPASCSKQRKMCARKSKNQEPGSCRNSFFHHQNTSGTCYPPDLLFNTPDQHVLLNSQRAEQPRRQLRGSSAQDPAPRPLGQAASANSCLHRREQPSAASPPAEKLSAGGFCEGHCSPAALAVPEGNDGHM